MTAVSPSQGYIEEAGTWLRRQITTRITAGDDVIFTIPDGSRVHDCYVDVDTGATGTTLSATLEVGNSGGDVVICTVTNMVNAGITGLTAAAHTEAVETTAGAGVSVKLSTGTITAITAGASIEVGILVTRERTSAM